jgi:internalin A
MTRLPLSRACALVLSLGSSVLSLGCDQPSSSEPAPSAAASPPPPAPTPPPAPVASTPPAPKFVKRLASDCKPHVVDFGGDDTALEHEVRRKLGKDNGAITPADLATIKSINLASVPGQQLHQIDPCIFPMLTSLKDLFLGAGDYDDLTPIQKLTTLETLRASLSQVKDLHAIEGLKRMDRLDLSHTLIGDDNMKSIGNLVNVTELMLDEDSVSDLSPIANLKKLEKLSIKKTEVKNLVPLAGLKTLKIVYIADTPVTDITPVQPLVAHGMKLVQN